MSIQHFLNNKDEALVLDVRTEEEYCAGHICDSMFVSTPLPPLDDRALQNLQASLMRRTAYLDKDAPIFIYCKKGIRASVAADILKGRGKFRNVKVLGGVETSPMKDWIARGQLDMCHCINQVVL